MFTRLIDRAGEWLTTFLEDPDHHLNGIRRVRHWPWAVIASFGSATHPRGSRDTNRLRHRGSTSGLAPHLASA
jgi:hypothetical protein